MMSSAQVSEQRIQAPFSSPSTSGRMPSGSRAPIIFLLVRTTSEYAPSSWRRQSTNLSTIRARLERATRCRITSVSEVDWQIAPCSISSRRSVSPLVRLPLWPTAKPPEASSANSGWTLRRMVSPVVE